MKAILRFLQRESVWPVIVLVVGAIVLLLGLGNYGFWEPQEIQIADQASERAGLTGTEPEARPEARTEQDGKPEARPGAKADKPDARPPLTEWSVAQGLKYIGADETGARLPLALLGLIAMLATFYLGRRLASPRAGMIAALILVSFPLFLFESRQLMSQIGAVAGSALTVLGLVGLAWPADTRTQHAPWIHVIDVALIVAGSILSYTSAAALLGLVVPFGAVALACVGGLMSSTHFDRASSRPDAPPEGQTRLRRSTMLAGLAVLVIGAAAGVIEQLTTEVVVGEFLLVSAAIVGVVLVAFGVLPGRAQPNLSGEARWKRRHLAAVGALATAVALFALYFVLVQVFDLKDPIPGERALFGYSLMPSEQPSPALGGTWGLRDNLESTFDVLFEHIAFGLFPWIVLAPIALVYLLMAPQSGRHCFGGQVNFAWATLAWVVATILARKSEMVLYPALVPIAVAIAIWLDDLMNARQQADATAESDDDARVRFGMPLRPPLVALFVLLAVLALSKDIATFTDKFVSVHITGSPIQYPSDVTLLKIKLKHWVVGFALLFGLAMACGLLLWTRHKDHRNSPPPLYLVRRYGIHAAIGITLVHALFLAQVWMPQMSRKLSSKHIFSVYEELAEPGETLAIMGNYGSGPQYYAGSELQSLRSRTELIDFLRADTRVFALAPASELCAIHRTVKGDLDYYVLDDSNAKFLLMSNRLEQGEKDRNPLATAMVRQMPENIDTRVSVNFDDQIELIGVNMPDKVERGETFQMTLFFKVLKPVAGNWKIFVHFDGGGLRFQGDHDPVGGRCTTGYWQAGDYIIDTFDVTAGNFTYAKTAYDVYVGFFRGSHGNWKNMDVKGATRENGTQLTADKNHRVLIGRLPVE